MISDERVGRGLLDFLRRRRGLIGPREPVVERVQIFIIVVGVGVAVVLFPGFQGLDDDLLGLAADGGGVRDAVLGLLFPLDRAVARRDLRARRLDGVSRSRRRGDARSRRWRTGVASSRVKVLPTLPTNRADERRPPVVHYHSLAQQSEH